MDFEWVQGLAAGAVGVMAMTMVMMAGSATGMTKMNMGLILGSMFTGSRAAAERIGWAAHLMMGVVFGLLYALLWAALDAPDIADAWWYGLIFGAVHGVVAIAAMPIMSALHPRSGLAQGDAAATSAEQVALPRFAFGGSGFGPMTPIGIEMGHIVFGLAWGLVFWALVG